MNYLPKYKLQSKTSNSKIIYSKLKQCVYGLNDSCLDSL